VRACVRAYCVLFPMLLLRRMILYLSVLRHEVEVVIKVREQRGLARETTRTRNHPTPGLVFHCFLFFLWFDLWHVIPRLLCYSLILYHVLSAHLTFHSVIKEANPRNETYVPGHGKIAPACSCGTMTHIPFLLLSLTQPLSYYESHNDLSRYTHS
jgi:hypothetical protein